MSWTGILRRLCALGRIPCLGWTGAAIMLCVGPGDPAVSAPEGDAAPEHGAEIHCLAAAP